MSEPGTERRPGRRGLVGRVLGGRYRVERMVSAGASTLIVDATDTDLHRLVTVKLVRPEWAEEPEFRRRFRGTMRAMAGLAHPNVAAVYDWGEEQVGQRTTVYAVTEYLDGGSLRDLFDRGRSLDPSQALLVGLEACRGLDFAHRKGLVHSELTPSKLVFGDDRRLRIVDFGLARLLGARDWHEPATLATHVARYASPEQAAGEAIDGRSDVYSLTLILIEAVTRAVPFDAGSTVSTLAARIGRLMPVSADLGPLAAILERAGRPVAADRSTAAELGRSLVRAAEKLPRPAPIPILAANRFEDTMDLRRPNDPTGGVVRPRPEPGVALVPPRAPSPPAPSGVAPAPPAATPSPDEVAEDDPDPASASASVLEAAAAAEAAADALEESPEPVPSPPAVPPALPAPPPPVAPPLAADPIVEAPPEPPPIETAPPEDTVDPAAAPDPVEAVAEPEVAAPADAEADEEPIDPSPVAPVEVARAEDVVEPSEATPVEDAADPEVAVPAAGEPVALVAGPEADEPPADPVVDQTPADPPALEEPAAAAAPDAPAVEPVVAPAADLAPDPPAAPLAATPAPEAPDDDPSESPADGAPALYDGDEDATKDELAELARQDAAPSESSPAPTAPPRPAPAAKPTKERRGRSRWLTALVAFLILAALAVLGLVAYIAFRVPTHEVPALAGVTLERAQAAVADYDWEVDVRRERSDEEPDEGEVIRTAPRAGTDLAEGEPFLIIVSEGPELRVLPELNGMTSAEVQTALAERQLVAVADGEAFDEDVAVGDVVSWRVADDPSLAAGGEVLPGTEVDYVVSKGPEPRVLPDLHNLTVESAQAELDRRRLVLEVEDAVFDNDIVAGAVISMDPPAGSSVERGSTVTVIPSKGPDLVAVPELANLSLADARQALADAGLRVGNLIGNSQGLVAEVSHLGQVVATGDQFVRGSAVDLALF